ncbi:MAG: hypothetical protein E7436_01230 [Ruminococcaceae bacterium]|nr:hypothetical protein [Oscillospiraceae bacterium]
MMVSLGIRLRRWQRALRRWALDPKTQVWAQTGGSVLCGLLLSAGSLMHHALPLTLGLLMSLSGWPAVLIAAGGMAGYLLFWGDAGIQGVLWLCAGLPAALVMNRRSVVRNTPWLMPALAGVIVAGVGLAGQLWLGDRTAVVPYLLRIGLAILTGRLFTAAADRQDAVLEWLVCAVGVLALAQVRPIPYLGLGYIAAGLLAMMSAFPAVALAGLALDLAQVTPVPMTAVLALVYLVRLVPGLSRRLGVLVPGLVYLVVMGVCLQWDLQPLPGLLLGSGLSLVLPPRTPLHKRRGETGFAQVRLEMAASVLDQTQMVLDTVEEFPIDEGALMSRAAERACGSCPCRKNCREEPAQLSTALLHKPLGNGADLPAGCRKPGRLLMELRRSQEQFRAIRADRDRQSEYRAAVVQQYRFLSEYLQSLSDALSRRSTPPKQIYQPELAVCAASRDGNNGDRCFWFAGVECRYYILLCDGMGTGPEAAREGKLAGNMLKKLLCAGYPPEYALRSVNSFCALRGRAGAVTMDLAELQLDSGKVTLYKWGAAPSFLLHRGEPIKIGTAAPPPGLSVTEGRETVQRLSLRKGETLILLSDGAGGEESLRAALEGRGEPPGELAARILEHSRQEGTDDATVAVVRLGTLPMST